MLKFLCKIQLYDYFVQGFLVLHQILIVCYILQVHLERETYVVQLFFIFEHYLLCN